jgi:hypothetical protein
MRVEPSFIRCLRDSLLFPPGKKWQEDNFLWNRPSIRHWICQQLDLGLPSLQNYDKYIYIVCNLPGLSILLQLTDPAIALFHSSSSQKLLLPRVYSLLSQKLVLSLTSGLYIFWVMLFLLVTEKPADHFSLLRIHSQFNSYITPFISFFFYTQDQNNWENNLKGVIVNFNSCCQ